MLIVFLSFIFLFNCQRKCMAFWAICCWIRRPLFMVLFLWTKSNERYIHSASRHMHFIQINFKSINWNEQRQRWQIIRIYGWKTDNCKCDVCMCGSHLCIYLKFQCAVIPMRKVAASFAQCRLSAVCECDPMLFEIVGRIYDQPFATHNWHLKKIYIFIYRNSALWVCLSIIFYCDNLMAAPIVIWIASKIISYLLLLIHCFWSVCSRLYAMVNAPFPFSIRSATKQIHSINYSLQ